MPTNPTRFIHKQVRKLTDNQKAEMVLQKDLRPTPTSTNQNIAKDFGVHPSLVAHTSYESLSPTQKEIYHRKRADLGIHAFDLTFSSVQKAKELVVQANSIKDLPAVMGAAKIGNDIYRLETLQPTQITQNDSNILASAVQLLLAQGYNRDEALQALERAGNAVDGEIVPGAE